MVTLRQRVGPLGFTASTVDPVATFTFDEAQTITEVKTFFYYDGRASWPKSQTLEYQNEAGEWHGVGTKDGWKIQAGDAGSGSDGITAADFHSCTKNISDYTNQKEVQECRLSSMWDFNSESEKVQDIQSDYLASLWNAGVRGFRMDAVKHIHTDSVKAIKEKFAKKIGKNANDIYWIQEVIGNAPRPRASSRAITCRTAP